MNSRMEEGPEAVGTRGSNEWLSRDNTASRLKFFLVLKNIGGV